uniref:Glucosylceramidase n=1 Tax=Meloidogyne hapla TaxID=6305 RepID=A0A1I8BGJ5_MELHA
MTIENEPGAGAVPFYGWQAMYFSDKMQRDFALNLLSPILKESNITNKLKIIGHDDQRSGIYKSAKKIYEDPQKSIAIDGLGTHWYSHTDYEVLSKAHNIQPDKFILATEACNGYLPWEHKPLLGAWFRGQAYGHDILNNLKNWVIGWIDWNLSFSAAKKRGQSRKQSSTDFGINNWKKGGGHQNEIIENDNNLLLIADDPNSRLNERLRSLTRPLRRPVKHSHDTIEVHVRCSLYQIVDLDQRNNLATLSAYFDVHWEDAFLNWNVSEFDGITTTFIPLRWVWRPEFYLYHSIQGRTPEYDPSAMAELHNDGQVRLFVPITSRALCPINVKHFPYDMQNCTFLVSFI